MKNINRQEQPTTTILGTGMVDTLGGGGGTVIQHPDIQYLSGLL